MLLLARLLMVLAVVIMLSVLPLKMYQRLVSVTRDWRQASAMIDYERSREAQKKWCEAMFSPLDMERYSVFCNQSYASR